MEDDVDEPGAAVLGQVEPERGEDVLAAASRRRHPDELQRRGAARDLEPLDLDIEARGRVVAGDPAGLDQQLARAGREPLRDLVAAAVGGRRDGLPFGVEDGEVPVAAGP